MKTANTKAFIGTLIIGALLIIYGYYSDLTNKDEVLQVRNENSLTSDNLTISGNISATDKTKINSLIDKYEKKTLEANEALELIESLDKYGDKTILDVKDNVLEKAVKGLKEKIK